MTVWNPCKCVMPKDDEEVLFAVISPWENGKPRVTIGRHHTKDGKGWWTSYFGGFDDYEVGWWMPLPSTEGLKYE